MRRWVLNLENESTYKHTNWGFLGCLEILSDLINGTLVPIFLRPQQFDSYVTYSGNTKAFRQCKVASLKYIDFAFFPRRAWKGYFCGLVWFGWYYGSGFPSVETVQRALLSSQQGDIIETQDKFQKCVKTPNLSNKFSVRAKGPKWHHLKSFL